MINMFKKNKPWNNGIYTYPGTDILINVPEIKTFDKLMEYEYNVVSVNAMDAHTVTGAFDKKHICAIHKHLFGDVYPWAGEIRTVNIFKADGQFMDARLLNDAFRDFHNKVKSNNYLKGSYSVNELSEKLADCFVDLNKMHPFREGNGRTTRVVLTELAYNAGYALDFSKTDKSEWINASRCAQYGTMFPMINILKEGLSLCDNERIYHTNIMLSDLSIEDDDNDDDFNL